jgi:hypothetical protein
MEGVLLTPIMGGGGNKDLPPRETNFDDDGDAGREIRMLHHQRHGESIQEAYLGVSPLRLAAAVRRQRPEGNAGLN